MAHYARYFVPVELIMSTLGLGVLAKMPNQNKAKAFSDVLVVQSPGSKYLVKRVLC
jgi:hypothetical protein